MRTANKLIAVILLVANAALHAEGLKDTCINLSIIAGVFYDGLKKAKEENGTVGMLQFRAKIKEKLPDWEKFVGYMIPVVDMGISKQQFLSNFLNECQANIKDM